MTMLGVLMLIMSGGEMDPSGGSEGGLDKNADYLLENEVLYDDEHCSIIIKNCGLDEDGYTVEFSVEMTNKTSDSPLMFLLKR